MIGQTVSSKRYARAVFELAQEKGEIDRWLVELQKMSTVLATPDVQSLLRSPKLPFAQKRKLLEEQLKGLSPLAVNLASLLVLHERLPILSLIVNEYGRLVDEYRGIKHVQVVTAVPLAGDQLQQLSSQFGAALGKKIVLEPRVDPAIIGGLVARVDDRLIDGSVRNRLQQLKTSLAGA